MRTTHEILIETKSALPALTASRERKNQALLAIADRLLSEQEAILEANRADLDAARSRYGEVMLDRLKLTPERIAGMAQGVREVAALPDPEGRVLRRVTRPNGMVIEKTRHLGRRGPGPQIGQRGRPARRARGLPLQLRDRTGHPQGA